MMNPAGKANTACVALQKQEKKKKMIVASNL